MALPSDAHSGGIGNLLASWPFMVEGNTGP
jgi:hypothetical protein